MTLSRDQEPIRVREGLRALLLEALELKDVTRAGWLRVGVESPESVAAHSWGVAWMVAVLCPDGLNRLKAIEMALVHDLAEVRTGDITPHDEVDSEVKRDAERRALASMLAPLAPTAPLTKDGSSGMTDLRSKWQALCEEYRDASSPEARLVKACDKLDMALQAEIYAARDTRLNLDEFVEAALDQIGDKALRALIEPAEPR